MSPLSSSLDFSGPLDVSPTSLLLFSFATLLAARLSFHQVPLGVVVTVSTLFYVHEQPFCSTFSMMSVFCDHMAPLS